MIRINDLLVELDGKSVIHVDSATLSSNTIILGPNGSGKTVLLKTIVGFYKPSPGSVFIEEFDVNKANFPPKLVSTNVESAYLLSGGIYLDDLLDIYCRIFGCNMDVVKSLPSLINPKSKDLVHLSIGEKKWLTTVLALNSDSRIVVLDEPLEDLDPWLSRKMAELILEHSRRKQVVITLHSTYFLRDFIDWDIFLMFEGKLYGSLKARKLFDSYFTQGLKENALLAVKIGGVDYSIVEEPVEGSLPLKDVGDLTQLYRRIR
jgi:ABC-type multidrug transport system ATPase subunit